MRALEAVTAPQPAPSPSDAVRRADSLDPAAPIHAAQSLSGALELELVDPVADLDWDRLVASHPHATVFHQSAWAKVLSKTYGHIPLYLRCSERDQPLLLLPMMEVRSVLTGRRGVCLPFTDLCAPLSFGKCDSSVISASLLELAAKRKWKHFEVRSGGVSPAQPDPAAAFYGHTLDLSGGPENIFARFDGSVRRAIRKAERSGLSAQILRSEEAVLQFYRLHVQTRKRHGVPPQPVSFFLNIYRELIAPGLGFVALAAHEGNPVAAAVFFHTGRNAIYKYGASNENLQALRPTNLVMWEAIQFLAQNGSATLHFGRTSLSNEGLRRFKLGWGATEEAIEYAKFDLAAGTWLAPRDKAAGLHNAFFRTLPTPLNRLAGALLYPHLD